MTTAVQASTVTEKSNGDVLVHCHAGCALDDVLAAVGLDKRDLFAESNGNRQIVAEYDYLDETGKLLYQVVRFEPKDFRQRRPDGAGGWEWSLKGTPRVLYRLPRVLEAVERREDIMVVEGEKDVDALEKLGIAATTNPGGCWQVARGVLPGAQRREGHVHRRPR
jgi:putative DNA primase/helicase